MTALTITIKPITITIKDIPVTAINILFNTPLIWDKILSTFIADTLGNLSTTRARISLEDRSDLSVPI